MERITFKTDGRLLSIHKDGDEVSFYIYNKTVDEEAYFFLDKTKVKKLLDFLSESSKMSNADIADIKEHYNMVEGVYN